ncbi:MAG: response regulator [Anaerolineales bacterium]|nr:response regulator [Anaerolineales bacterium]MCA9928705.1 response regulator [Anaerolineales bacterium]
MKNNATILYIEDNHDNRKLVSRVLQAEGYIVYGAESGESGLAFVQEKVPDLILIDLQLPHIDGYTVTAELRKMQSLVDTPIVALTANVMKEDQERSAAAGCNGFIQKPINVDLLPTLVEAYLVN